MFICAARADRSRALGGCGSDGRSETDPASSRPAARDVRLPRGTWPSYLAFDERGSLWITESSADAVAERRRNGRVIQHRLGEATETSVEDIVSGPDGNMWFEGFQLVGWITPDGQVSVYTRLTAGPDGAVWFTQQSRYSIGRVSKKGKVREFPLKPGTVPFDIVSGSDGAL